MFQLFKQSSALFIANVKSLRRRIWISLSMVFSIALVVIVLLGFLSMSNGFEKSLSQASSDEIAIALGAGATTELGSEITPTQLHLLQSAPEVARTKDGQPILSPELVVPVNALTLESGENAVIPMRGIGSFGFDVRPAVALSQGRMFTPGTKEIIVGERISSKYRNLGIGNVVTLGSAEWTVVGTFSAAGSAFEGEIFADKELIQTLFNRPNLVQSVRLQLTDAFAISSLIARMDQDARNAMPIKSETEFFANMAQGTSNLIRFLGWPLAVTMAIGSAIGALTTMYSSVSDRSLEIATLRNIGFSRMAAFISTWLEAMLLTTIGCAVGIFAAYAGLQGRDATTAGSDNMQIGFELSLSGDIIVQAAILALIIGAFGGGLPALNATRVSLRTAMTGRA